MQVVQKVNGCFVCLRFLKRLYAQHTETGVSVSVWQRELWKISSKSKVAAHFQMLFANTGASKNCQITKNLKINERNCHHWTPYGKSTTNDNERKPKRSTVNQTASSLQTNSKQIQSIQRRSFESLTAGRVRKKPQKAHGEPIGDTTVVIQLLTKDLIEKVAAHFQNVGLKHACAEKLSKGEPTNAEPAPTRTFKVGKKA